MKLRKLKRYLNIYNLAILCCLLVTIISLFVIINPKDEKTTTASGTEVVNTKIKEDEEISEDEAINVAIKQFKILGETVSKEDLSIKIILRKEDKYYYIASKENTLEIKIKGGEITRINSASVKE